MDSKIGAAAIALTSVILAFGGGSVMTNAARAQDGAMPNASCGSPSPCLLETNTSSGPGVKSSSNAGNGLIATTKALGSNSTNGRSALLGQDLQTTSGDGLFNFGVSGMSTNGTGVIGSGAIGVVGATPNATGGIGFLAKTLDNNNTGALLYEGLNYLSPVFTVDTNGFASFGDPRPGYAAGGVTVTAYGPNNTPMFAAKTGSGTIFEVFSTGSVFIPGNLSVNSIGANTAGTITVTSPTTFNYPGLQSYGLTSTNSGINSTQDGSQSGTNFVAIDAAGVTWLYQGYSTVAGKYTIQMGDSGSVYARVFITTGTSKVAQQTSTGARVDTYSPQITEPSLEDFGEAQLDNGIATVRLDPRFASAMDTTTRYFVTVTPEGDCRGLYVAQRDAAGFVVRELQGGRSSIAFTYRIVARPLGDNSARLAPSTLPYGFDHKVPPPQVQRAPHRAMRNHRQ
jgi:hypothetical protein